MQNNLLYKTSSSVYPGEYTPMFPENDFNKTTKHLSGKEVNVPPVNIKELNNSYKIELAITGTKRENIFLKAYENILFFYVIQSGQQSAVQKKPVAGELNFDWRFVSKVVLPHNADPSFVSAEYKAGTLRLYVSKSTRPSKKIDMKIAIY